MLAPPLLVLRDCISALSPPTTLRVSIVHTKADYDDRRHCDDGEGEDRTIRHLERADAMIYFAVVKSVLKRLHSRMAALLEPQLNFIRTFPFQTKDKIRLLIQKLVELSCHCRFIVVLPVRLMLC